MILFMPDTIDVLAIGALEVTNGNEATTRVEDT
jgi:hypothetical protein